jgi:phosphate transport system permease protein
MTQWSDRMGRFSGGSPARRGPGSNHGSAPDRPSHRSAGLAPVLELGGSALSALAFVFVIFQLGGVSASFGMLVAWFSIFLVIYGILCWQLHGPLIMKDKLATVGMWSCALAALIPLLAVLAYVVVRGGPVVFKAFPHFFLGDMSQLSVTSKVTAVGAGAAIVGTIEQVGLATLLTVPLGILTAVYLVESRAVCARVVGMVVDAMTGMPAIIAGIFVYLVWVAPQKTNGKSGFAAALALAVMMLPIVTRTAQEVIAVVPGSLREAASALGAPDWRVILRVVLPTARVGIVTAVILGVARIAGETAPILFAAGGNNHYNWNPFHGFQDNLPLRVYELSFQASGVFVQIAWGVSFVLVVVVLALFVAARLIGRAGPGRRRISFDRLVRPASLLRRAAR